MQHRLFFSTILTGATLAAAACSEGDGPMIPGDGAGGTDGPGASGSGGQSTGGSEMGGAGGTGGDPTGGMGGMDSLGGLGGLGEMGGLGGMDSGCLPAMTGTIVINEVNAAGSPADWVEFYNTADTCVDLSGARFIDSDDPDDGDVYVFPAATIIEPGAFVVIEEETDFFFGIKKSGEDVYLFEPGGTLIETIALPDQDPGPEAPSSGRATDGADVSTWKLFDTATKGALNG